MNILGINGSIGNKEYIIVSLLTENFQMYMHQAGATLFIDGELKGSLSEERLTGIKYDGKYPTNSIDALLARNNLFSKDIDIIAYASITSDVKRGELSELFKNAEILFIDHHLAHAAASFLTSGFEEANIFTFDGVGDLHTLPNDKIKTNNANLYNGNFNEKEIRFVHQSYLDDYTFMFGYFYDMLSNYIYKQKIHGKSDQEQLNTNTFGGDINACGKIMGLSAYGDHTRMNIPDSFRFELNENGFPIILLTNKDMTSLGEVQCQPEDLAAWAQRQFEKYLLLFLGNIPKEIKKDKLCLGGGCALNILANSKIIENGIYEDIHINTAPDDSGLNFGAAILVAYEKEKELILPDNMGCIGLDYNDEDINETIVKFGIESANEI